MNTSIDLTPQITCSNMFICGGKKLSFVRIDKLCVTTLTCGVEPAVCKTSRKKASITTELITSPGRFSDAYFLLHCQPGLHSLRRIGNCAEEPFPSHTRILGVILPKLGIPESSYKIECNYACGATYFHLSCHRNCLNAPCPMPNQVLPYNGCPHNVNGKLKIYSLVNNDRLTFVRPLNQYHYGFQSYFQCKDYKCIRYLQ